MITVVDAFSQEPFGGNPAAVVYYEDESEFSDEQMRQLAAEMNLSETAFVRPLTSEGEGQYALRWWTPTVEVPLCGHATLATSHVLANELNKAPPLVFHTLSGQLVVRQGEQPGSLEMDFPLGQPVPVPLLRNLAKLQEALGASFEVEAVQFCARTRKLLLHASSLEVIRQLAPDSAALMALSFPEMDVRGVIVTAAGQAEGLDCVSRYFAPWNGIPEDPVTGSAHTVLGVYWSGVLGKRTLRAYQASARGGHLSLRVEAERIFISGSATTVLRGSLAYKKVSEIE